MRVSMDAGTLTVMLGVAFVVGLLVGLAVGLWRR